MAFPKVQVRDDQQVGYCHSEEMVDQSALESALESTKEPVPPVSEGYTPTSMEGITVGVIRNVEHQPLLPGRRGGIPYPPTEENVDLLAKWLLKALSSTFRPLPTMCRDPEHMRLIDPAPLYAAHTHTNSCPIQLEG